MKFWRWLSGYQKPCKHERVRVERSERDVGAGNWRRYGSYTVDECVRCLDRANRSTTVWGEWKQVMEYSF